MVLCCTRGASKEKTQLVRLERAPLDPPRLPEDWRVLAPLAASHVLSIYIYIYIYIERERER